MSQPTPRSEETIFAAAVALPEAARAAYLDGACAGDTALRSAVDGLLKAHAQAGEFLRSSPGTAVARTRPEEQPGEMIGRYKLLQKIGEGGCGVVYMAEQEVPVRRRVALKVIKLGMDTKAVVARFEAERQALALMDHPNIAKVLDAGATEAGRPFFVMELVRGVPVTKYCDEANLPTEGRLGLFNQICHAIQHAHQKGIIHRDIKPSNILVTMHDGVPVPKVIDFGIAKATQGRLTDQTMFTAFEQFMGTPAYMSPEQAEMSGLDIDTRSDIYSLGVLLYELLSGRTPFEPKTLIAAGLDEMRRLIREVEPPRPSQRLGTMTDADRATVAKLRGTAPAALSTVLAGDLDWIVMRCLEKDRTRRYGTPTELAADIQRHLQSEPVVARPPTAMYRLEKLVRRNRAAAITVAAVAAALVIGTTVATWQAVRARKAEQEARKEAQKSERVAKALASVFSEIGPHVMRGEDTKLFRALVDESMRRLPKELENEPAVLAWVTGAFAGVYFDLLDPVKAHEMAAKRLELLRTLNPVPVEDEVDALATTAIYSFEIEKIAEGERLLREAQGKVGQLPAEKRSAMEESLLDVQVSLHSIKGDYVQAREVRRQILGLKKKRLGPKHLEVAQTLMDLSYQEFGFYRGSAEREGMILEAYEIRRSQRPDGDPLVAEAALRLSEMYSLRGRYREAEALLRRHLGAMPQPLPKELWRWWEGMNGALANLMAQHGKLDEAIELGRKQLAFARANFAPDHDQIILSLRRLGELLMRKGDLAEAEIMMRDAWQSAGRHYGTDSIPYASSGVPVARVLAKKKDYPAAESLLQGIIKRAEREFGSDDIRIAPYLTELARVRLAQGDVVAAIDLRRRVLSLPSWKDAQKDLQQDMSSAHLGLATVLIKGGGYGEAEEILLKLWDAEAKITAVRHQHRRDILAALVELYGAWSKQDSAKAEPAARWEKELKEFDAAQERREAAVRP